MFAAGPWFSKTVDALNDFIIIIVLAVEMIYETFNGYTQI